MTTLKPGDRVLATDTSDLPRTVLKRDAVYTDSEVDHLTGRARSTVTLAEVPGLAFDAKRFTLEPQAVPEFQAGDIVEWTGSLKNVEDRIGRFYRVKGMDYDGWPILEPDATNDRIGWRPNLLRLAFRPPEGEVWEPWNGGSIPSPLGSGPIVEYVCRSGGRHGRNALSLNWMHDGLPSDVIAYRVVEQPVGYREAAAQRLDDACAISPENIGVSIDRSAKSWWRTTAPVDVQSLRPGDRVLAWVAVSSVDRASTGGVHIESVYIPAEDIKQAERPVTSGDRVRVQDGEQGTIQAKNGPWLLVNLDGCVAPTSYRAEDVERL